MTTSNEQQAELQKIYAKFGDFRPTAKRAETPLPGESLEQQTLFFLADRCMKNVTAITSNDDVKRVAARNKVASEALRFYNGEIPFDVDVPIMGGVLRTFRDDLVAFSTMNSGSSNPRAVEDATLERAIIQRTFSNVKEGPAIIPYIEKAFISMVQQLAPPQGSISSNIAPSA